MNLAGCRIDSVLHIKRFIGLMMDKNRPQSYSFYFKNVWNRCSIKDGFVPNAQILPAIRVPLIHHLLNQICSKAGDELV